MMLAMPFRPQTAITAIDIQGKVLYQYDDLPGLKKIWVNDVSDAKGNSILLAGKSTSAWTGHINTDGKVFDIYDTPKGEFDAAVATRSGGFAFTRGKFLDVTDGKLLEISSQKMSLITTRQYVNRYLSARLPEDLPAQQILALRNNEFLVLFKLGSKLLKLHVENLQ